MRVKLTVVHTERGEEPRTYVLEQDPIVIGRAGTCDLPLDDPDRVVSKQHAEIRRDGDGLRVFDLGSKNQTFVGKSRVGTAGLPVASGDQIQIGPFHIGVEIDRDLLVADDLDRTVFGAAFANPFQETAEGVAEALGKLRRAFATLDYGHRGDALDSALRDAFGPGPDAQAVAGFVRGEAPSGSMPPPSPATFAPLAAPVPAAPNPFAPPSPSGPPSAPYPASRPDPFAPPSADPFAPAATPAAHTDPFSAAPPPTPAAAAAPAAAPATAALDAAILNVLAASAARLVSIPGQFRHEFLGHTVAHAPETAFLFDADVDALVEHLSHADPAERSERHRVLTEAAEAVLHHHQALLEGYRAAARNGAAALVNALDPDLFDDDAVGGGLLPGARERAVLDLVRQRVAYLRTESFAAAERRVYRPAFAQAYLDAVARSHSSPTDS